MFLFPTSFHLCFLHFFSLFKSVVQIKNHACVIIIKSGVGNRAWKHIQGFSCSTTPLSFLSSARISHGYFPRSARITNHKKVTTIFLSSLISWLFFPDMSLLTKTKDGQFPRYLPPSEFFRSHPSVHPFPHSHGSILMQDTDHSSKK